MDGSEGIEHAKEVNHTVFKVTSGIQLFIFLCVDIAVCFMLFLLCIRRQASVLPIIIKISILLFIMYLPMDVYLL